MAKGWAWLIAASCGLSAASFAQTIFRDGFETPCSDADVDGDRLSGCMEALADTNPTLRDTDGDGLPDGDELLGTLDSLDLPALGVNPRRKDILLEYDWFDDANEAGKNELCPAGTVHSHRPTPAMLDIVTVMFGAAPVGNPDGSSGINVIHDYGQGGVFTGGNLVPDADGIVVDGVQGAEYVGKYEANFAQNRRGYFHYVLMPHRFVLDDDSDYSGNAEIHGGLYTDAMMVSLYCIATTNYVGNTIAHELGHNLRLNHGGARGDLCNHKPNHNSVMNYRYQFFGVDNDCHYGEMPLQPADFSRGDRLTVNEAALSEPDGVCAGVPTDFNGDGDSSDVLIDWDINHYGNQVDECGGMHTILVDHDDWSAIVLPIISQPNGGGGSNDPQTATCPGPPPTPQVSQ